MLTPWPRRPVTFSGTALPGNELQARHAAFASEGGLGVGRGTKIALAVTGTLVLAFIGYFAIARPIQVLPQMQTTIPFEMADQDGNMYRYPDRARPMNMYIIAAGWDEEAVSRAEHVLNMVHEYLVDENLVDLVEIAWITPDPINDDVESIRSFAASLPILETTGTSVLTAPPTAVRLAVGAGLGIYVGQIAEASNRVSYDPGVALVDDVGYLRGRYNLDGSDDKRLLRDIGLLAAEVQAEGSERALYKAAHLFLCYPR